ncbi:MAG: YqjD family protein, partial [Sphingomonadaceae bacterium]
MDQTQLNGHSGSELASSQAASAAARDKLMQELNNVIGEAEQWLHSADRNDSAPDPDTRARFEDTLRTARSDLLKLEDTVIARTRLAAQTANAYVKDNPWKTVGLGAAAGVIIGLLIARK